jgi:KaiC/GvpD/RAD55 family RecA-like ATPase
MMVTTGVLVVPRISLIEGLTEESIPPGYCILVEYDPASQWFNASISMAAEWLKQGGGVVYQTAAKPPETVRTQMRRLGFDLEALEAQKRFELWDAYTVTLGLKSKEKHARDSLKVGDLSLRFRWVIDQPPQAEELRLADTWSVLGRFNEERSWVEFMLTRLIPSGTLRSNTTVLPITRGVHSDWAYKQLEDAADGVVDVQFENVNGVTRNVMRIRNMRDVHYETRWYPLKIGQNFEVTLEK